MQQGFFYSALKSKKDIEVVSKFHQSGITGFLPILFPGVCYFMTTDYARSINQGTDKELKKEITTIRQESPSPDSPDNTASSTIN